MDDGWVDYEPSQASAPPKNGWVDYQPAREPSPRQQAAPSQDGWVDYQPEKPREPPPEAEGQLATGARELAHGVLPTVAGAAAGSALAPIGAALGTMIAPGIGTAIGYGAGFLLGGGAAGYAASTAQESGLKMLGADDSVQRAINTKINPWSSAAGSALSAGAGFGVGAAGLGARALGAGINTAIEGGTQLAQGEFSPEKLVGSAVSGAAFARPRGFGTRAEEAGQRLASRMPGAEVQGPPVEPHGSSAPQTSAGTAEEHIPPAEDKPGIGNPHNAVTEAETEGYAKPKPTETGAPTGVTVLKDGEPDPTLASVLKAGQPERAPGPVDQATMGRAADEQVAANQARAPEIPPIGREPTTVPADHPSVVPEEAVQRDVIERGRSGRPIRTEPLPIGTEEQILERGLQRVEEGPRPGEVPPPEMQAMARKGAPPTELPEGFTLRETPGGRHILEQNGRFRGDFPTAKEATTQANRFDYAASDASIAKVAAESRQRQAPKTEDEILNRKEMEDFQKTYGGLSDKALQNIGQDATGGMSNEQALERAIANQAKRKPQEILPEQGTKIPKRRVEPIKESKTFTPSQDLRETKVIPPKAEEAVAASKAKEIPVAETPLDTKVAEALAAPPTKGAQLKAQQAAKVAEALAAPKVEPAAPGQPVIAKTPVETPAAEQGAAAAKVALADVGGAAPPGKPPRGPGKPPPPPPEGPKSPRQQLVAEGKLGDEAAMKAARNADAELHKLSSVPAGEAHPLLQLTKEAAAIHPEIKRSGDEKVYHAIENGTFDQLPGKLKDAYNHVAEYLDKRIDAIRKDLVDRGKIESFPEDPNHVHRMVKNVPDRTRINVDPLTEGRLPGITNPSSLTERAFRGAQAADGERLVLSGSDKTISVMKDRQVEGQIKRPDADEPIKTGDKLTYKGKEYVVDGGRTNEIEQHATHADGSPVEYHKSAVASKIAQFREMKARQDYYNWIDNFKGPDSPFKAYMTRDAKEAEKRGWGKSEIPDLEGLYFHPNMGQVLHNNYNPGLGGTGLDFARGINQFAVRSIFWNPVPHSMNALFHYIIGRGGDWVPFDHPVEKYRTFGKSIWEGFEAAYTQNGLLQDMNRQGASLVMSKIDSQNLIPAVGKLLEQDLRNNPAKWEQWAREHGLGKGIDGVKLWYDASQRALWTFSDALMASRIRELEMLHGMSREQAIDHARIHMPDYRLPIEVFGSKNLVNAMADSRISIFGRYHMGMLNSLSHMTTNLLGPKASMDERKEALGNVLALVAMGFVVKPVLDKLVQTVTGNEKAETNPRGPLGPVLHTVESLQGKKDIGQVLSNLFTFSPAAKMVTQTLANRDFAGRPIVETGSPLYKKVAQSSEYIAGNLVSPYATFGPTLQPGTSKRGFFGELGQQLTDVKVPTEAQQKGKRYGELMTKREALKREKKPRGLIEYLTP